MVPEPLMLEGIAASDGPDSQQSRKEQQRLEDENRSLRRDLDDALRDKERLERSIENLRAILAPLHRGLRSLFGEIELAVGDAPLNGASPAATAAATSPGDPRWQSFKNSFPGVPAEIIDALLIHGDMKMTNLSKFLKRHYETTRKAAYKLRDAGAVTLAGGALGLKR
jgi:hypothetical protein